MKKLKLITLSVLGFSLACSGITAIAKSSKAIPVHAAGDDGYIMVGNVDLLTTPSAHSGTAVLDSSDSSKYVLTLNGYNNTTVTTLTSLNLTTNVFIYNIKRPLTIKIKGTVSITNSNSSQSQAYGIYALGSSLYLNIVGEGTSPKLNITSPAMSTGTSVGFAAYGSSATSSVSISNVEMNATSGKSYNSFAIDFDNSPLTIGSGAKITATAGGCAAPATASEEGQYRSVGIIAGTYTQTGGTVKAISPDCTGAAFSTGLQVNKGDVTISNGGLEAKGGNVQIKSSTGLYAIAGNVNLNDGAEVVASAGTLTNPEEGSRSYGIEVHDPYNNRKLYVTSGCNYLYATTAASGDMNLGINLNTVASYAGYGSNSDMFDDNNRATIEAGSHLLLEYKQFLFQRVQYTATSLPVTYDGTAHTAMSLSVTYPTSSILKYRVKGQTSWYSTIPTFTEANEDGYDVEFSISHEKFVTVYGEVKFYIHKAAASVLTAPTLVPDFEADGETLQPLVNGGTANGGTLMFSVNDGEYSEEIPTVKYAGSYEVKYKVFGDANHTDTEAVSLGTVNVTGTPEPQPVPPSPEPGDNPSDPSSSGKMPGWGVALIVIGSLLLALVGAYFVLFFLLCKWIKVGDKAVRVLPFALGKKDGQARVMSFPFKFEYRPNEEIYKSKDEALK